MEQGKRTLQTTRHSIQIDDGGVITTIAGTGANGLSGDGGPAVDAELNDPIGIAVNASGELLIADEQNGRVRAIGRDGVIETVAGGGETPFDELRDGSPATSLDLGHPYDVVLDREGNLFVSDFEANAVWRIDPSGRISRFAGSGTAGYSGDGGPATDAELNFPAGLAIDRRGNLFISDSSNNVIRMVDRQGVITTVVGTGSVGFSGDGGPATEAQLNGPAGIVCDAEGNLYIADQANNLVRRVDPKGVITTVAGVR